MGQREELSLPEIVRLLLDHALILARSPAREHQHVRKLIDAIETLEHFVRTGRVAAVEARRVGHRPDSGASNGAAARGVTSSKAPSLVVCEFCGARVRENKLARHARVCEARPVVSGTSRITYRSMREKLATQVNRLGAKSIGKPRVVRAHEVQGGLPSLGKKR